MNIQRVIIADNQPLTAYALERLATEIRPSAHIEHATASHELTRMLNSSDATTAILLDYTLFDFENQEQLILLAESTKSRAIWLLVSDELTSGFLRYVLYNTENVGVVFKDATIDVLHEALHQTLAGNQYVSQHATKILFHKPHPEETQKIDLTQTEREVLKLIAQGKTTKEIAAERFSSIHTINSHRKNIFRKLNVNCVHDALKYALRSGLVDESEFYI